MRHFNPFFHFSLFAPEQPPFHFMKLWFDFITFKQHFSLISSWIDFFKIIFSVDKSRSYIATPFARNSLYENYIEPKTLSMISLCILVTQDTEDNLHWQKKIANILGLQHKNSYKEPKLIKNFTRKSIQVARKSFANQVLPFWTKGINSK